MTHLTATAPADYAETVQAPDTVYETVYDLRPTTARMNRIAGSRVLEARRNLRPGDRVIWSSTYYGPVTSFTVDHIYGARRQDSTGECCNRAEYYDDRHVCGTIHHGLYVTFDDCIILRSLSTLLVERPVS